MHKKLFTIALTAIMVVGMAVPTFSQSSSLLYTYVCPDNSIINYQLDAYGTPFFMENGEKIYAAIPLSHLEVKNKTTVKMLNDSIGNKSSPISRAAPSTYEDITSTSYEKTIDIESLLEFTTPALKINREDTVFHIQGKNFKFLSFDRTVHMIYYYYIDWEDKWYATGFYNVNISNNTRISIVRGTTQYFSKVYVTKVNDVKQFTLTCWTGKL